MAATTAVSTMHERYEQRSSHGPLRRVGCPDHDGVWRDRLYGRVHLDPVRHKLCRLVAVPVPQTLHFGRVAQVRCAVERCLVCRTNSSQRRGRAVTFGPSSSQSRICCPSAVKSSSATDAKPWAGYTVKKTAASVLDCSIVCGVASCQLGSVGTGLAHCAHVLRRRSTRTGDPVVFWQRNVLGNLVHCDVLLQLLVEKDGTIVVACGRK